jgi:predicted PurR-regulated permease PerM
VVVVALSAAITIGVLLTGSALGEQIDELVKRLPRSLQRLQQYLARYEWAQSIVAELPKTGQELSAKTDVVNQTPRVLFKVFGALGAFVIFLFLGLYLAIDPGVYMRGLLHLVPLGKRDRVQDVLHEMSHMLGRWLVGRMISLLIVGGITTLGLWLLRVPLALALGLLVALTDSPTRALGVLLLYLGIQGFESYVLTPLIEKRAVALPPALTITAQVLLGLLAGGIGLVLAAPLAAVAMVLVQRFYVEDVLGDSMEVSPHLSD